MTTVVAQQHTGAPIIERIAGEFARQFSASENGQPSLIADLRFRALEELQRLGIPTVRHEEWKYTNLFPLLAKGFTHAVGGAVQPSVLENMTAPLQRWGDVVAMYNGRFVGSRDDGQVLLSLASALAADTALCARIGSLASFDDKAIVAWNTAFLNDGVVLRVPANTTLERPIVVASVLDAREHNVVVHERHFVEVGSGGFAQLVLVQRALGDGESLLNQVLEGWVGEGARLVIVVVQDGPPRSHALTTHTIELAKEARVEMITVSIGGGFVRNMPEVRLSGSHADAHLYGLTLADGTMLVDHHTAVEHRVPHCTSNQLYKAILDGRATGVFNGKICVYPDAQKTSAYQANRNIVLSRRATIDAKPQLEIYANDVRCTHGCTVGRLDDEAMFYLRSRGLSKAEAEALLLTAFAEEVTTTIPISPVRDDINATIEHLLHADELA